MSMAEWTVRPWPSSAWTISYIAEVLLISLKLYVFKVYILKGSFKFSEFEGLRESGIYLLKVKG